MCRPIRNEAIEKESIFWPIKLLNFFGANAHLFWCVYFYANSSVWPTRQKLGAIPTTSGSLLFCEGESEMERARIRKRREKEHWGRHTVWWENTPHETHRPVYLIPTLVRIIIETLLHDNCLKLCIYRFKSKHCISNSNLKNIKLIPAAILFLHLGGHNPGTAM